MTLNRGSRTLRLWALGLSARCGLGHIAGVSSVRRPCSPPMGPLQRGVRRVLMATMAVGLLVACGDSGATVPPASRVAGTYTLRTINGSALPALLIQNVSGKLEVLDDAYTLSANLTYAEVGHVRTTLTNSAPFTNTA